MTDIYDIKIIFFEFLYSYHYLAWILIFLVGVVFYKLLMIFFHPIRSEIIEVSTDHISDDLLKKRFQYLVDNIQVFSREIFYREIGILIRMIIARRTQNSQVHFMTLGEIKKKFDNIKEYYILSEVYYLEFDSHKEDTIQIRKQLLEKIIF